MLLKKVQVCNMTEYVVCIQIYTQYEYVHIAFGQINMQYIYKYIHSMYMYISSLKQSEKKFTKMLIAVISGW